MGTDLSMIQEFGESLSPAVDHPPAEVRHRVMNGMREPVRRSRPWSTGVGLAWRLGTPAGVATAVVAALVAGQPADIGSGAPAPPGHAPGATTSSAPDAPSTAGHVLRLAAQHAAATPVMRARPDQFLFIDSVEVQRTTDTRGRNGRTEVAGPQRTRTWLSVDGTRDGLMTQEPAGSSGSKRATRTHLDGCTDGLQAETIDRPETTPKVPCTPEPAYRPGRVPTDPAGLLAYAYEAAAAEPRWVSLGEVGRERGYVRLSADQRAFQEIADLLYRNHSPAVQEAAVRSAGLIPGVAVRRGVTDASGRAGVAVTRTEAGTREELVFDPRTYAYLGQNATAAHFEPSRAQIVRRPDPGKGAVELRIGARPKPGDVIFKVALLRVAIVDEAGRLP